MKVSNSFKKIAATMTLVLVSQAAMASSYCTIDSSFDGSFDGRGRTQLEAEHNAKAACQRGSRSNGLFCDDNTLTCDSSDDSGHGGWHHHDEPSSYCTIDSSFDGTFSGRGRTELEARTNARRACQSGSRSNGLFCDDNTIQCESN